MSNHETERSSDERAHLLTTRQVAEFVAEGYLRLDGLVPSDICEAAVSELAALNEQRWGDNGLGPPHTGTPLADCYPPGEPGSALGDYLRCPQVRGVISSLVGPNPTFDHDFVHHISPGATYEQPLHVDAIIDSTDPTFDIQLFWFPRAVKPGEGGTRFVPGSHLHRVNGSSLDRYQHIRGEQRFDGPAGTVMVFHHGLWHAGQPNPGSTDRWLYKVRLNPTQPQVKLWNTDDLDELHNDPSDHFYARMQPDSVAQTFRTWFPWQGVAEHRNNQTQRARLWRYLTGDDSYDVDHYLTRLAGRAALLDQKVTTSR
jgi:hypothetical protein